MAKHLGAGAEYIDPDNPVQVAVRSAFEHGAGHGMPLDVASSSVCLSGVVELESLDLSRCRTLTPEALLVLGGGGFATYWFGFRDDGSTKKKPVPPAKRGTCPRASI